MSVSLPAWRLYDLSSRIVSDPCASGLSRWIKVYAADQGRFFNDFTAAYTKLVGTGARWGSMKAWIGRSFWIFALDLSLSLCTTAETRKMATIKNWIWQHHSVSCFQNYPQIAFWSNQAILDPHSKWTVPILFGFPAQGRRCSMSLTWPYVPKTSPDVPGWWSNDSMHSNFALSCSLPTFGAFRKPFPNRPTTHFACCSETVVLNVESLWKSRLIEWRGDLLMHQFCLVEFFANLYSLSWASWVVPSPTSHVVSESSSLIHEWNSLRSYRNMSPVLRNLLDLASPTQGIASMTLRRLSNQKYRRHSIHKNVLYIPASQTCV